MKAEGKPCYRAQNMLFDGDLEGGDGGDKKDLFYTKFSL